MKNCEEIVFVYILIMYKLQQHHTNQTRAAGSAKPCRGVVVK